MREFYSEISSNLLGIVFENEQPIFSRNKRGDRTSGFEMRKAQITRGIDRFFRVFLIRHMSRARFAKHCYFRNGKIVLDGDKFQWGPSPKDWTLSDDFDQDSFHSIINNSTNRMIFS